MRAAILAGSLVLAAGCTDSTAPLQREGRPADLQFSTSGFGAPSRMLELRGDTVVLRRTAWAWTPGAAIDSVRVVPSPDAWRAFWTAAEDAGVQAWRGGYVADGVMDGTGWTLRLMSSGRQIEAFGSNAYPDRRGGKHDLEMPPEFGAFVTALNALAGQTVWF
jgi:hypothetical protein